ncbi:MAG: polyphosphate kinase 1 [Clostridiales Family XIII bacterium]|jgi:polyphosphate kinase|nr:polyphosphate kinase 1 [Clostridiales Family XIII bacterium]
MADTISTENAKRAELAGCMQNRELSWLKFNKRVLEEAGLVSNPPLERLRFISIFSSNLDEFFMIRVGSLTDYMLFAPGYCDNKTGMTAKQQLDAIFAQTLPLYALRDRCFGLVTEELLRHGVCHMRMRDLDRAEQKSAEEHFVREILPLLSPQIIDSRHPFPHIDNKRLHIAVTIERKGKLLFGFIAAPRALDRLFFLEGDSRYVLLEDIICHFAHLAFKPYAVRERTVLAVTRNADLNTEDDSAMDEGIDYRQFMQSLIRMRKRLAPVRLELQCAASREFMAFLCEKLNLKGRQVFLSAAPLDLSYCSRLEERLGAERCKALVWPPHIPSGPHPPEKKAGLLKSVQKKDVLFSYPFENVSPFLDMIRQASEDAAVLSIQITLYRIDLQSKLAESLIRAAENGKEVIVLMELRARFDEANNIEWSQRLDEAGCRVIYGLSGYKVHSKICLITRKEFGRIQRITQIGTGNYNERTVRQYTDLSLITANREIGEDAAAFFNSLLLGKLGEGYALLWVAPNGYKSSIMREIERERLRAESGEGGRIGDRGGIYERNRLFLSFFTINFTIGIDFGPILAYILTVRNAIRLWPRPKPGHGARFGGPTGPFVPRGR